MWFLVPAALGAQRLRRPRQRIMGAPTIPSGARMLSFGKCHGSESLRERASKTVAQLAQSGQSRIDRRLAVTLFVIAILPTLRAQASAIVAAEGLHREIEQHLLRQDWPQVDAFTRIIIDVKVCLVKLGLFGSGLCVLGLKDELELPPDDDRGQFQTSGTANAWNRVQPARDSDAVALEQLSLEPERDRTAEEDALLRTRIRSRHAAGPALRAEFEVLAAYEHAQAVAVVTFWIMATMLSRDPAPTI